MPKRDLARSVGIHPRKVAAIRNGWTRPRPSHRAALIAAAGSYARVALRKAGTRAPIDDIDACRLYVRLSQDEP
jgi:hypothetical protein